MIRNSLEWVRLDTVLRHQANTKITTSANRVQVCKMIKNIDAEITLLSKAEVLARRGNSTLAETLLTKINNDIEMVEGFILVGALIG